MVGSALILLREGLEGALIVAIVLAYLNKLGRRDRFGTIWAGAGAALAISFGVGTILFSTVGDLEGDARKLTFAIIMGVAACVLTWMIFWMRKQARAVKGDLQTKVDRALVAGSAGALAGGGLGLLGAAVLAYAFYRGAAWLDLRQFFMVSGAIVLLFAAGLLSRSIAEFQVLGYLPTFWYPVFDLTSLTVLTNGHFLGDLLRGLFGWDPAPSIEELAIWLAYIGGIGFLYFRGMPRPR